MKLRLLLAALALALAGCPTPSVNDDDSATPTPEPTPVPDVVEVPVTVTLDGAPAAGVSVMQGGQPARWTTAADGTATVSVDLTVEGDPWVVGSSLEARQTAALVARSDPTAPLTIALTRLETDDNPEYQFKDPGEPDRRFSTEQCAHCHISFSEDWVDSQHREAAKDPQVQDLYAGTGAYDATGCGDAGGDWLVGPLPGGGDGERCYLGAGVLPALNTCDGPCDTPAERAETGACADCHAPGINGVVGGRDLLEAVGHEYEYGVHCDVCHRVESVDLDAPAGVAGALRILRPSGPGAFAWPERPLTFGPYDDVPNGVMGAVQRDHFTDARLCAGCHQLDQEVLVPGEALDAARWPDGTLPIHTTYGEWAASNLAPSVPCSVCHMPPNLEAGNSADIALLDLEPGLVAGWYREPGTVKGHAFEGARDGTGDLLQQAAAVSLSAAVETGVLTATATVTNVGAGHAIPTGEPLRSLVLIVEARCADDALAPTGGFALSDVGGALASKDAGEDWTLWPGAIPGMVVRVVARPGTWRDEPGFGPFGDGTFSAEQKGMPVETVVGSATIVSMDGDVATFDGALPTGDAAWLGEAASVEDGTPMEALAGAPGTTFARVLAGADGARNVPHFLATDVVSDNRLLPAASWSGTWTFDAPCATPTTTATLLYRQWPLELARERGWAATDVVIAQATE